MKPCPWAEYRPGSPDDPIAVCLSPGHGEYHPPVVHMLTVDDAHWLVAQLNSAIAKAQGVVFP